MKSKDQQLLEEAYQSIIEAMRPSYASKVNRENIKAPENPLPKASPKELDDLIAGFHMNPNREKALAQIQSAYQYQTVTLYKHGHGSGNMGSDQYESEYELTQNDVVTGRVEKITYTKDEDGYHLIFVVAGKPFDLTQGHLWVKLADLGDSSASKARSVSNWTGGSALRPPGMR